MSLITRCPACGTAFRVQTSQLAAHEGAVRCGKCDKVFNGVAALIEDHDERGSPSSPEAGLFDAGRQSAQSAASPSATPVVPDFLAEPRTRRRWLWATAALMAMVAIGLQIAYHFRAEIAGLYPDTKATLQALCQPLGCDVPLPRRPELMSIDSSELQADSRREGLIVLNAVIRNRARFPQEYPALELTLTDEGDRPILRRVLSPRDYLEPPRSDDLLRHGIAAGGDTPLHVFLDTSRTPAVGYRLYLFYPL